MYDDLYASQAPLWRCRVLTYATSMHPLDHYYYSEVGLPFYTTQEIGNFVEANARMFLSTLTPPETVVTDDDWRAVYDVSSTSVCAC
jgi:hypothetical protein